MNYELPSDPPRKHWINSQYGVAIACTIMVVIAGSGVGLFVWGLVSS